MAAAVAQLEDHIRTTALTKRIRPSEFFIDFDRLRSGYVTESQFFRVLWENLGIKLEDAQQLLLKNKYGLKKDGRLNYKIFCDIINKPFNPNDLNIDPSQQKVEAVEFLGTTRSLQPLSADEEACIEALLRNISQYYKYHGINLRTCCEDFDWHHIGVIQESQFYRSFPRPPEVKENEMDLLVRKYRDPLRPGLLNYLNLHHDIEALAQRIEREAVTEHPPISVSYPTPPVMDLSLQQVFDKIRIAVFKNRVRTIEFFKDFDKLRSGIITENQFICGLTLAIGKEAQLSRTEIQMIVEYYRLEDGRVRYKDFTDMMENAFTIPELEKKPTQSVIRPPTGVLGRSMCRLTSKEEARVEVVISQLNEQVKKRRLMMYQYFRDFDRSKAYSRIITPSQFGRILHFLSLNVDPEDFKLLCKKFADPSSGDINYPSFVQCVDNDFLNYTQDQATDEKFERPNSANSGDCNGDKVVDTSSVNMDDLMARIRHHALINRRRVGEFFQDYDRLRTGNITKSQFRRGLSDFGMSAIGQHNLSNPQFEALAKNYENPKVKDKVMWTKFMADVESVFTQPNLEKNPTHQVPPPEIFVVPKPGTMDWSNAADEYLPLLTDIMNRLSQRAKQRRVLIKPVFQDFDKHNNGHITRKQFRQCLTMLEMPATEAEMQALEAMYCNDAGFNYNQELEPPEKSKLMYVDRVNEIRLANSKPKVTQYKGQSKDLEEILLRVKSKVFKERIRILEWLKDYDKLRSGRMIKGNFRRALDLCQFELAEAELAILEDHYQAPGYPDYVNYLQFSDDVEAIFTTKDLEKAPLLDVNQFCPPKEWVDKTLESEKEPIFIQCMDRIADKVRKHQMQLFPLFEDYDKVHNGTVSRSQFRRVLNELQLANLVSTEVEWQSIYDKYCEKVGGRDDVNYNRFCERIYELAGFEWRKP